MRTTIRDIAEKTNLSITTVSLVLNNKPNKIAKSTKDKIFKAAEELNYIPNQVARAMVRKSINIIGLILPDIQNTFFADMAKGVEKEARKYNYRTMLCDMDNDEQKIYQYLEMLYQNGVKNVIIGASDEGNVNKTLFSMIKQFNMNAVFIDQFIEDEDVSCVSVNNEEGGYLAARHLIELGHKKIGCIAGNEYAKDSSERLAGFKKGLKESGIELEDAMVVHGNYTLESGSKCAEYLLKKDITAIFAFNDMMALGTMQAARGKRIDIPGKISLIGFDDILFSKFFPVSLTTISQPILDMSKKAVKILIEGVDKDIFQKETVLFQPKIIIRESTRKL